MKYFIGHKVATKNKPLCIFLPKMSSYRKHFDETKYIFFLIKDNELLKKYDEIWEKVKNSLKKFDSEWVYNLKAKKKSYNGKINTNFPNSKIPKKGSQFICLSVILINSVFKTGKNYCPQALLEECKYVVKEKNTSKCIIDNIEISSDPDEEILMKNSDEENSNKENFEEENFGKESLKSTSIFFHKIFCISI